MSRTLYTTKPNWSRPDYWSDAPAYRRLSTTSPTARKEHPCAACKAPILPGQRHRKIVCLEDGHFASDRYHNPSCFPWA